MICCKMDICSGWEQHEASLKFIRLLQYKLKRIWESLKKKDMSKNLNNDSNKNVII